MVRIDLDIKNLNKAINDISRWEKTRQEKVKRAINTSALSIQKGAKSRCTVDTGRLRASIAMQPHNGGMTIQVGTKVKYAPYVEFGTGRFVSVPAGVKGVPKSGRQTPWLYPEQKKGKKTGKMIFTTGSKPKPFLFPAAEAEKPKVIKRIGEAFKT